MFQRRSRFAGVALVRGPLPLFGPAFVAAVAYIDPGNFATNITAGSRYGYLLVWVLVASNLMAMLIQYLSAKAGIATGRSLPELCRDHFPRRTTKGLWAQAELVAIATDLAEVLGGAIALQLLFDIPLLTGGLITAVVAFALLGLQSRGARPFEVVITGMLLVVLGGFLYSLVLGGVDTGAAAAGLTPRFEGTDTVLLATGMLGATVMPHVIYLHGALTQNRYERSTEKERLGLLRSQRVDVVAAMALAGLVNLAMLVVAAQVLSNLAEPVETIEAAHAGLAETLGPTAALLFALALLASGFAASGVGTLSGQVVMQGFLRRRIPLVVRRVVTLAPALVVIGAGVDPTQALVISQVILSFGIPFALIPLVMLTRRRDIMGALVNSRLTTAVAATVAAVICLLNVALIVLTFGGV
ncbi:Nramp family divalent metal transporter [Nocardioides donggukensis]|uniref:Divalent metal cation transporter MntH n=1 Tax=Nocardioides donggukensis TaxID=2774019 RepID=A0A927K432_9ACTN|nr:Nramp family divalent metal transporter [Nocardioides donggukensis]MBD8870297.1 Nramp family divalent metal transporter [Nocardioides donggukensis]